MLDMGKHSSVIREIFEYSKKRKAEIGEDKVFDFSLGNPSIPTPEEFNNTLIELIKSSQSADLHGYTSAVGDNDARCAIAENIRAKFGFEQSSDLIYMTCGAAASLTITLKALISDGGEVILLAPYFPEYKVFVENAGGVVKEVLCDPKTLQPDVEKIREAISDKTAAIIINSPNNPTGAVFSEKVIKELSEMLTDINSSREAPIYIISDEPYRALAYDGIKIPYIPCVYPHTVVCTSYSKSLSIPGERIGYIALSPKAHRARDFFFAICGAGRSMGYVCAPSLFQKAIALCDTLPCDISAYDRNRRALYNALCEIGYECIYPQGAFYLFVKALEPDANAFAQRARAEELLIVPSDSFGIEGWVRIAYCTSFEQIEKSIPSFKKLYDSYQEK
jgi:aspartate aminotransferase